MALLSVMLYFGNDNIIPEMMECAVFSRIGHANSELARSIWLPCAADLPISHIG